MANWPCQNPSCKSHGQPHPNCRCPSPMAEGGMPENYCTEDRQHLQACEYYADGGDISSAPLSFDSLKEDASTSPTQQAPTQFDDLKSDTPSFDDLKDDTEAKHEKYGSLGQQALTAVEGAGRGFLGPIAPGIEKGLNAVGVPGLSDQDIAGRAEENPVIHGVSEAGALVGGMLTGTGEAGLIAKGVGKIIPAGTGVIAKVGSAALKGALEAGLFQSSDEISNAMIGKGDPETPVASALSHIGAAALFGGATGGLFSGIGQAGVKGLQTIENTKMAKAAKNAIVGMGIASKIRELGLNPEQAAEYLQGALQDTDIKMSGVKTGMNVFDGGMETIHNKAARYIAGTIGAEKGGEKGYDLAGIPGAIVGTVLGGALGNKLMPVVERIIDRGINKANNKYVFPAVIRAISEGNTDGLFQITKYAEAVTKGDNHLTNGVNALFKAGGQQLIDHEASDKDREKLNKFIEDGGLNTQFQNEANSMNQQPQGFAKGGKVEADQEAPPVDHIATAFPEQSMVIGNAKSRIYNYLNSARPQPAVGMLPYDKHVIDKTSLKSYHRALDIANKPLSILNHIKDGTLLPEHVKHLAQMYPEVYKQLSKKMQMKMAENQMHEEMPNYRIRQGISLLMGAPVESSFTPSNIMAAQSIFQPKLPPGHQESQPAQGKTKKGTTTLGKSNKSYQTADQSAESDRSVRK